MFDEYRIEITKDEYEELIIMSYADREQFVNDKLPISIACGYGYYGHRLRIDPTDGKYYIICDIGTSCD
mgnify:CR=1 FL=1